MGMLRIDLNCDMGESFGIWRLGDDEAVLPYITSANIACGVHAGDPSTMRRTVRMALDRGVAVGAHPGLPDLVGFGRRNLAITPEEAYDLVVYQVGALAAFVKAEGGRLQHVKPHGALYNMAAKDRALADAIAAAVAAVDPGLILFGLAGSELVRAGQRAGLRVAAEAFADRTYQADGSLTPRRTPGALIDDPDRAAEQVVRLVKEGKVRALDGTELTVHADTVCLHGDGARAVDLARVLRARLEAEGIAVKAVGDGWQEG